VGRARPGGAGHRRDLPDLARRSAAEPKYGGGVDEFGVVRRGGAKRQFGRSVRKRLVRGGSAERIRPRGGARIASSNASSALVVVEPDAMDQGQRRALVTALIGQGVFTGVQVDSPPPKVGVTPLFQGLSDDLKQQFIATVYGYVNNGAAGKDPLQLIDATNGKMIGTYTAADGLKLS
jgi:hypothetical protein